MSIGRRLKIGGMIFFSAVVLSACAGNVSAEDLQGLGLSPEEIESILSGVVEGLEDGKLMIDGNIVEISDETEFEGEIEVGDEVEIKFHFDDDGGMIAQSVEFSDEDDDDSEVEFVGIVESMGADVWVIGGKNVAVTSSTEIKGGISEGDLVKVHASPDDAGDLVAREIEPAEGELDDDDSDLGDDDDEMEMVGVVESVEDGVWTIDGKAFATLPGTEIEDGLSVGDIVEMHFSIDEDGSLVAYEIEASDDDLDDGDDLDDDDLGDDDLDDDEYDDDDDDDDEHEDDEDHEEDDDDDDEDDDDNS